MALEKVPVNQPLALDFSKARPFKGIVIHHSATPDGKAYEWDAIRKYHMSWRYEDEAITEAQAKVLIAKKVEGVIPPFRAIGYHAGIELAGDSYVYCVGRTLRDAGAAAKGFNDTHVQICLVGSYDASSPTVMQIDLLKKLIRFLMTNIKTIKEDEIIGHWETFIKLGLVKTKEEAWAKKKTCPGKSFPLESLRLEI